MGGAPRCARCGKGLGPYEKWVAIDNEVYHAKCAKRVRSK